MPSSVRRITYPCCSALPTAFPWCWWPLAVCRGALRLEGHDCTHFRQGVPGALRCAGCDASGVSAYIGPHILGDEYEVSQELMDRFAAEFSCIDASASRMLDLSAAIREALVDVGVDADNIVDTQLSTVRQNDRFYSYRNEGGTCGRHAAIGVML